MRTDHGSSWNSWDKKAKLLVELFVAGHQCWAAWGVTEPSGVCTAVFLHHHSLPSLRP